MNGVIDFLQNIEVMPMIISVFWVVVFFTILYFLNNFVFSVILSRFPNYLDRPIKIARGIIRTLIVIFAIIAGLDKLGFDVFTLIASFGVTGFIVTFALKDMLTSVLSGAMVMIYRPFKVGDRIRVTNVEGIVKKIDLQYTIVLKDGKDYHIPNSKVAAEAIIIKDSVSE
jgi:small conductance mechanosensitive channel